MFHVELRRFPHNFCRFNLSEPELRALVLDAWAQGRPVDLGERRWSPHEATLTVLEGPELPVQDLALGRGWRNAQRRSHDVTADLLRGAPAGHPARVAGLADAPRPVGGAAAVGASGSVAGAGASGPPVDAAGPTRAVTGVLAADLVALLGEDAESLLKAWQLALRRHPDKSPSECLALAEDLVRR